MRGRLRAPGQAHQAEAGAVDFLAGEGVLLAIVGGEDILRFVDDGGHFGWLFEGFAEGLWVLGS